jgi:hypothetical protein
MPKSTERYVIYRVCDGSRDELGGCPTPEALGVKLVQLAEENMFVNGKVSCPVGIFDQLTGAWLVKPWLPFPTPKNASDGARAMALARWRS